VSATRPRLLVDVTQYVNWPATTGVQRVVGHLAADWEGSFLDAKFGFIERDVYVVGPIENLGSAIATTFERLGNTDIDERGRFVRTSLFRETKRIPLSDVGQAFDAYLLPEPSLRADNLAMATDLLRRGCPVAFIYYDALPLTNPEYFARDAAREPPLIRYNHTVAGSECVAFISHAARRTFESRIARRTLRDAVVAPLGADGLARVGGGPPVVPVFTMVGTVEGRKRHLATLEAFERLWADGERYRLVLIGAPGADPTLVAEVEARSARPEAVWLRTAGDDEVARQLSTSTAVLFTSDAEGYGLPPLEALALGCPVIVSADLPALENVDNAGQFRLEAVTPERIMTAVRTLADPDTNATYRRALDKLHLPTWKGFAEQIEGWLASSVPQTRPLERG
jgi:glycosyltransferase involved in cell wall biosynthesis